MPYTKKQRQFFHELAENPETRKQHGVSADEAGKLADEADNYVREGKEKPAKKAIDFIDLSKVW